MNAIIESTVMFVVRALAKYGAETVIWEKVREDAKVRVGKIIPGEMFDEVAQNLVVRIVNIIEDLLKEPATFEEVKAKLLAKDYKGLISTLVVHSKENA